MNPSIPAALEVTEPKTIPDLSVDTQLLIERLNKLEKGEFIEYKVLNQIVAGDVQKRSRGALQTARHRLLKDERKVFEIVRRRGIKRIEDNDAIGIGESATRRVRRTSRKAAEKMLCVDYDKLTKEEKTEYNTYVSVLGALCVVTKTARVKAIRAGVVQAQEKLALNTTLELFKG